jgi:hypothetical protein
MNLFNSKKDIGCIEQMSIKKASQYEAFLLEVERY